MPARPSIVDVSADMSGYVSYVAAVEQLATDALAGRFAIGHDHAALDGEPSRELRLRVALEARRDAGAFFTTSALRDGSFASALPRQPSAVAALDPACGAGDLLLRWSDRLGIGRTLEDTVRLWGDHLHGVDLQPEFVRLTRARLILAAAARSPRVASPAAFEECFPKLSVGNGLDRMRAGETPPWVLQNPPFGMSVAPAWFEDGSGLVSQAAVFVSAWLDGAPSGGRLVALLPDTLRTGSRYAAWRQHIESNASILIASRIGQFAVDVDIDVFLLSLRVAKKPTKSVPWWPSRPDLATALLTSTPLVGVGPVVPHRDPHSGDLHPFLSAQNLPRSREADTPKETRRYEGRLFQPPFVAVRRTSRPGQTPRARATVVLGTKAIAVENHLLVVTPSSGGVAECRRIAALLEERQTTKWLDQRLGGRHLTTVALQELLGLEP